MGSNAGIPVKLLYEAENMKITIEMKNGETYRGTLLSAEDSMNVTLNDVVRTNRTGQVTKSTNVYLRGSSIRFIALPDVLKNAPIFKKIIHLKKRSMDDDNKHGGGGARSSSGGGSKRKQRD